LAKGLDEQGSVVAPRLAFTTRDKQATAVIGLGSDAPAAELTVAWYRLTGIEGREHLFSHEIAVGPGALAYSQGIAEGGLAPGLYETVATLGERQVRTPWVVRRRGSAATASRAVEGVPAAALVSNRLAQTPEWDLPSPGENGVWDSEFGRDPRSGPRDGCEVEDIDAAWSPYLDVNVSASWFGPCSTRTLSASVSGPPVTIVSEDTPPDPHVTLMYGQAGLCELPGGSDLPGTVVRLEATGSATGRAEYRVEDHGETLLADVESIPAAGSKVAPGERIKLHALAMVMPPALGVKVLYVDDGNDLIESVGNLSGASTPVACDPRRNVAQLFSEYRDPPDPPPVIEICANAEGFDGTRSRGCIEFYTGEVWEGTASSAVTTPPPHGPCGNPARTEATVRLLVAEDGSVKGTYDVTGCGVSEPHAEWTGTVTDAGFLFPELVVFTDGNLIPKVSPTRAEATLEHNEATAKWVTTWELTCTSCEE